MAEATPIRDSVTGAGAVAVLQQDLAERAEELLPKLLAQIEETQGYVAQAVTLSVRFKPASESTPAVFELAGKLAGKLAGQTNVTTRATEIQASGKNGLGPMQLTLFTREA